MGQRETWLVTGGAGFLGIHMCRALVERGCDVISYDIATIPPAENLDVREIVGDIRDSAKLDEALQGVDRVVHAAAALALVAPEEIAAVNAEGTRNVLEACERAGVQRLVYVSTTAVYGMPKHHPISEDTELDPMGDYGIAKARAEQYVLEQAGVETVIIRPKSFIGTGRLGIFQVLFDWIESGCRIYILGDGSNRFQLLSVLDLVEAIRLAGTAPSPSEVYNIGASDFGSVNEDVGALLETAGTGSRICHIPARPAKFALWILEVLHLSPIYRWVYDTADQDSFVAVDKAERELGWKPRYSNRDALISTYQWYLGEGKAMAQQEGTSHRVAWKQGALKLLKAVS
jgi:nucleoside-diphosphate-sugar epimerase